MSSRSKNQGLATMTACITQDQRLNTKSETKTKKAIRAKHNRTKYNKTERTKQNKTKQD